MPKVRFNRLPAEWDYKAGDGVLKLIAPSLKAADQYLESMIEPIRTHEPIEVFLEVRGKSHSVQLPVKCSSGSGESLTREPKLITNVDISSQKDLAIAPDRELILAVEDCEKSSAITRLKNSKVLVASSQIESTNGKPYDEVVGESLTSLWHPDELDRLMTFLKRDNRVNNYEYWCWKWFYEDGDWIRRRQNLAAEVFQLLDFRGVPCRFSMGVTNL